MARIVAGAGVVAVQGALYVFALSLLIVGDRHLVFPSWEPIIAGQFAAGTAVTGLAVEAGRGP